MSMPYSKEYKHHRLFGVKSRKPCSQGLTLAKAPLHEPVRSADQKKWTTAVIEREMTEEEAYFVR